MCVCFWVLLLQLETRGGGGGGVALCFVFKSLVNMSSSGKYLPLPSAEGHKQRTQRDMLDSKVSSIN